MMYKIVIALYAQLPACVFAVLHCSVWLLDHDVVPHKNVAQECKEGNNTQY